MGCVHSLTRPNHADGCASRCKTVDRSRSPRGTAYEWRKHAALLLFLAATTAFADRGALNPDVTQATIAQTICVPGYAKGVGPSTSYTNGVKQMLMQRAKMNPALAEYYELDHIIPLALGGHPRKLDNLALQLREGENGAERKDGIETKLQCLVCSHQVTLAKAQREILENWQAAYHKYARVKCHRRKAAPNRR